MAFDITAAIWVLYLGSKGLNLIEIGLLESIFHITGLIFEIPTGVLADLLGRKKVIIIGRVGYLLSCIIMLFADSFLGFALGFIVQAICYNLNSGSEEALVYDSLKEINEEDKYTKICGKINLIIEIAQALAVFIGGLLSEKNFSLSYVAAVLIGLTSLVIAFNFKETTLVEKNEVNIKRHFKLCFSILKENKDLVKLLLYFPLVFAFSATVYFYGQRYFSDLGLSKISIAIIFLINGIMSSVGSILSERFEKRFKGNKYAVIPIIVGVFMVIFSFSSGVFSVGVFWIIGLLTAALYPISSNKINLLIPSEQRATIISIDSMMYSVAMIIIFPLAGYIGEQFSLKYSFLIIGCFVVVLSIIEILITRKRD